MGFVRVHPQSVHGLGGVDCPLHGGGFDIRVAIVPGDRWIIGECRANDLGATQYHKRGNKTMIRPIRPSRVSAAAKLVAIGARGIRQVRRPPPPPGLVKAEADEWRDIVNRLPPDWFPRETHAMLKQYCRLAVRADQVSAWLNDKRMVKSLADYYRLLRMENQVTLAMGRIATKMKLSQQGTYERRKK